MQTFVTAGISLLLLVASVCAPVRACTSFTHQTAEGSIFGANLDLRTSTDGLVFVNRRGIAKENIRKNSDGTKLKWVSKYGSITFNVVGRGFVWSGMNESGLVISSMEWRDAEYPVPDERTPFDPGSWIQYMLDNFASVDEVVNIDSSVRLVTDNGGWPSHFLVADAKGRSAALDYIDGKLVVYTGKSLPISAMTNMSYGRALEAYQNGGVRWWWSNPGRSAERFATAAKRMSSFTHSKDLNATAHAFDTLGEVADQHTKWSVVYNIDTRKIWFRSTTSAAIKSLKMESFDFSCTSPLLMIVMVNKNRTLS